MINGRSVLAIIPARGGSKGLPGKNIKYLCGKPLIAWSIEQALKSKYVDNVFVSTDSGEIEKIAKECGANVPFLRPAELAADDSPTFEAILHALEQLALMGESYDYVALLEPTSPLKKSNDIDDAISMIVQNTDTDCLVSVGEVHMEHPMIVKKIDAKGFVAPYVSSIAKIHQRQQADKAYFPYGVIYISRVSEFKKNQTFYTEKTIPYFIERWQNYEIDDELDFMIIEQIMKIKMEEING
ncbi:MAG: acylneuraminate cytidylyltransferase [Desulfobacterales bacterium PC51MH44]|jgi:CMP-N-acetylneuraminic acid synthetase|nr:MAG: acylneuraminate cytidylyltransferase [Desulfobacterales bacterium PC51MH44]